MLHQHFNAGARSTTQRQAERETGNGKRETGTGTGTGDQERETQRESINRKVTSLSLPFATRTTDPSSILRSLRPLCLRALSKI